MLTDIFARRYENAQIWKNFDEPSRRLIVQTYQLLQQICPYYIDGKVSERGKLFWTELHDLLARELGLKELSPKAYAFYTPQNQLISGVNDIHKVCETWMLKSFDNSMTADVFVKERLSLVEIGFRKYEEMINRSNTNLPTAIARAEESDAVRHKFQGLVVPGKQADGVRALNASLNTAYRSALEELNARFRQAGRDLHYHNGFIQITVDPTIAAEVEGPFWELVAHSKWKNVDHDMKEAIDLRDNSGRDPAFYAVRALESTIKIISDEKKFSNGKERGAHNHIDKLTKGGLIDDWEAEALKIFFTKVRNPLSHGPGAGELLKLNVSQTNWVIENCMIWIRSLIGRI